MSKLKVLISGGGTGGHAYPAIAIANALKAMKPEAQFLFVGAKGKMEMEAVPKAGYKIKGLWISGFSRSLSLKNILFPIKLGWSILHSFIIVLRFRPNVAIGTGGFASGPVLQVASWLGTPIYLQEQNAFPGVTNRLLAKRARKICVAYEGMEKYFRPGQIFFSGNPIRGEVIDIAHKRDDAFQYFGLKDRFTVLIVGGSLGARPVNKALKNNLNQLLKEDIQLIWQTGKVSYEEIYEAIKIKHEDRIKALKFIDRMDLAYAAADVIVSRAGAIAVSELSVIGKPVIMVPYPYAAENHQLANAESLVKRHAAVLVTDDRANTDLVPAIIALLHNPTKRRELGVNISKLGIPDAADRISKMMLDEVI